VSRGAASDPKDKLGLANLCAAVLDQGTSSKTAGEVADAIDFIGGARGLEGLEKRVNSGEMAIAFALYPTQMADLMAVADAGLIMPPKSTWFEPKLADGMVNHVLD